MRVLVVPKWYPWPDQPVFGIFCQEQARALARRHDVVVLTSEARRRPAFPAFRLSGTIEGGLPTIRLQYRRPWARPAAMAFQIWGMLLALARLRAEGWRPDIVHAHVYSAGLPALVLARLSGARLVVSEHYTGFQRGLITGYDQLTARVAFRRADLVAPVSNELAAHVEALEPRARVQVVENVVDTEVFHPPLAPRRLDPDGKARLLTVASLTPKKGHAILLEALVRLNRERDVRLDLVGEGELRGELTRRARQLEVEDQIRFHGELPQPAVAELMRQADLFVLPSLFENLPCVLIEAMASGLPSVATSVGGVPELMPAVARAGLAANGKVVSRCPETRANPHPLGIHAVIVQVLDHELELVQEGLAKDDVLGPYIFLVVRDEVPEPEMLGHPRVFVVGCHLDKALGILIRFRSHAASLLRPIP